MCGGITAAQPYSYSLICSSSLNFGEFVLRPDLEEVNGRAYSFCVCRGNLKMHICPRQFDFALNCPKRNFSKLFLHGCIFLIQADQNTVLNEDVIRLELDRKLKYMLYLVSTVSLQVSEDLLHCSIYLCCKCSGSSSHSQIWALKLNFGYLIN